MYAIFWWGNLLKDVHFEDRGYVRITFRDIGWCTEVTETGPGSCPQEDLGTSNVKTPSYATTVLVFMEQAK